MVRLMFQRYVTEEDLSLVRSKVRRIDSKEDYVIIIYGLEVLADEKKLTRPEFEPR